MVLEVGIWQKDEVFSELMRIKEARDESLEVTINFLLELGIKVYSLDKKVMKEI